MNKILFALVASLLVSSAFGAAATCTAQNKAAANCDTCDQAGNFCAVCNSGHKLSTTGTAGADPSTFTCTACANTQCVGTCLDAASATSKCVEATIAGTVRSCNTGYAKTNPVAAAGGVPANFECTQTSCTAGSGNCKTCGVDASDTAGYGSKFCVTCNDGFALARTNTGGSAAWSCTACENKGCANNCATTAAASKCYGSGNCKTGYVQGTKAVDTTTSTSLALPAATEYYECKACTGTNCGTCKIDALDKCDTCPAAHFKESDTKCTACGTNCTECTATNCTVCNASFPGLKWNAEKKQCLSAFKTGAGLTLGSVVAVALFSLLF